MCGWVLRSMRMAKSVGLSIPELKDLVKTLEEEVLPLLEEVKNFNEVEDGISSIDLKTGKEDKGAEKNKESEGVGVVNTKEKELLNKQEELIKVYKQLEKLQDEELKQLRLEHEEEKKSWLQEEEVRERKMEILEMDLIEYKYRLNNKICIEEDLANLRDELEEKRRQQEASYQDQLGKLRKELEAEREMKRQLEESKEEELGLLRTEVEGKDKELKNMAEELLAERQRDANEKMKQLRLQHEEEKKSWLKEEAFMERKLEIVKEDLIECEYRLQQKVCIEEDLANLIDELEEKLRQQKVSKEEELGLLRTEVEAKDKELKDMAEKLLAERQRDANEKMKQLRQEHEEEKKSWLQEEAYKDRKMERLENDLIEYEYRLQCKICIEEDLVNLRDELEEKRLQQEASYQDQLEKLRQELEAGREMRRQLEESNVEELRVLQEELQAKGEELKKLADELQAEHQKTAKLRAAAEILANLEQKDSQSRTELHRAAERGDTHRVQLLLDAGSLVNAEDRNGRTPLWLAACEGRQDACRVLLAAGSRLDLKSRPSGRTALHAAAAGGHRAVCELLLAAGARPSEPDGDLDQWTALHYAACRGRAPVVQLLLQHGAERGARDKEGRTALDLASLYGRTEVAAMLQD
ncbi:golgin subfamily A member 6-like protein 22 isoform X1 [Periplaneta americana]|uniref:golgin subfamily A member 6-like protein 22 isoform X1 n=3 Tax=Periplaneta americana TaxID=6978 RepID=UPI0037E70BA4